MKSKRFHRLRQWGSGALVLLLFQGFGAHQTAWGGCNHRVASNADRTLDVNRLEDLIKGGSAALPSAAEAGLPRNPAPKPPCSGPGCSNRAPAAAPHVFPESDRFDQFGVLGFIEAPGAPSAGMAIDERTPRPSDQPSSIFHPPRA